MATTSSTSPTWMKHPMSFDLPPSTTVHKAGEKTISVKCSGHEKANFTVVLSCCADGTKLKPIVIFKRKTLPKEVIPTGIALHVNPKRWMDDSAMKIWLQKVWKA